MAGKKGVSGKTHTKKQLDNYANQNNPNNKAYRANKQNHKSQMKSKYNDFYYEPDYDFNHLYD